MRDLSHQFLELLIIAIPDGSVSWTVTHEEVFREPREWCASNSKICRKILERKFFYLFTCEHCFSHYGGRLLLVLTGFKLLLDDWRGYLLAGFAVVWIANVYMSIFGKLRLDMKRERIEIETKEKASKAEAAAHG